MSSPAGDWNAERMRELATRHARVESQRRLEELMETLVDEPLYEFLAQGLQLRGGARVRRYYQQFFEGYMSRVTGGRRLGQWGDERAVVRRCGKALAELRGPGLHFGFPYGIDRVTRLKVAEIKRAGVGMSLSERVLGRRGRPSYYYYVFGNRRHWEILLSMLCLGLFRL